MTTSNQTTKNNLPTEIRFQTINGKFYGTVTNIKVVNGEYHGKFGEMNVKWADGSQWVSFTEN